MTTDSRGTSQSTHRRTLPHNVYLDSTDLGLANFPLIEAHLGPTEVHLAQPGVRTRSWKCRAPSAICRCCPRPIDKILRQLERLPAVERVHTTSGRFDLACQLRTQSTLALDETLDRIGEIDGVLALESLIHLSTRIDRAV